MGPPSKYGVGLGSKQKDGGSKTAKRVGHPHKICCPDGSNSVRNNGMTVRTRQTAWDILTKIVVLTACNQLHITTTPIEAPPHATTAFGCILAITSAMLKKGKTLITPMENFIALTCREHLVDHVVFPSCSNRRRRRRLRRTTSCRCTKRARR